MPSSTKNAKKTKKGKSKAKSQAKEVRERVREERKEAVLPLKTTKLYDNGGITGDQRNVLTQANKKQTDSEGVQGPVAGPSTNGFLATRDAYKRGNTPFLIAPVSNVAVSDEPQIVDVQSGSQPRQDQLASPETSSSHEATSIEPPPLSSSSALEVGPPMPAAPSSATSRTEPVVEPFCYSHKKLVPIDLCIPPATSPSLPPFSPPPRARDIHNTVPELYSTYTLPPISCETVSSDDFENVMAAMGDIYHPSSIAATQVNFVESAYKNGYYYMPEDDPTWFQPIRLPFEECPGYRAAGPEHSYRG